MSVLNDKPVFTLDIHAFNTSYLVHLNGVAVFTDYDDDGQVTLTLPVNHWMHPEDNELGIDIMPPDPGGSVNPNANVTLKLNVHPHGDRDKKQTVATLVYEEKHLASGDPTQSSSPDGRYSAHNDFSPDQQGEVIVSAITELPREDYEGAIYYKRAVTVPSSLPVWAFFESDALPEYESMSDEDYYSARDELFVEYQKIQQALEEGDVDSIMPLFQERSAETDTAFYLEPGTTQAALRNDLSDDVNDESRELAPLVPDYVSIFPEQNRKLVRLARAAGDSAIGFNTKPGPGSVDYNLIYRRENGKWIITR